MTEPLRILIVEDNPADAELVERQLRSQGVDFVARRVEVADELLRALGELEPDIVVSDYSLPLFNGMEALRLTQAHAAHVPVIIITGSLNEEIAVDCMRAGAADYILKDRTARLGQSVLAAIEKQRVRTERDCASRALADSENRYRQLVELHPNAIVIHSGGVVTFVNAAAVRLFGATSPDELLGTPVIDRVHPDDREVVHARIDTVIGARQAVPLLQERFLKLDGSAIDVEVVAIPIEIDDKPAVQVVARNITERKQAEARLAEQLDVGREGRIIELKKEVNELLAKAGRPRRYGSVAGRDE
jgi:two-component system sensor histidine kinase/response regulator